MSLSRYAVEVKHIGTEILETLGQDGCAVLSKAIARFPDSAFYHPDEHVIDAARKLLKKPPSQSAKALEKLWEKPEMALVIVTAIAMARGAGRLIDLAENIPYQVIGSSYRSAAESIGNVLMTRVPSFEDEVKGILKNYRPRPPQLDLDDLRQSRPRQGLDFP